MIVEVWFEFLAELAFISVLQMYVVFNSCNKYLLPRASKRFLTESDLNSMISSQLSLVLIQLVCKLESKNSYFCVHSAGKHRLNGPDGNALLAQGMGLSLKVSSPDLYHRFD